MEACTAARAKAVEVDGVRVDSQWQLKYLPWGLRDGLGAAGLGVIMTHPTECYYLKTVLGWNDIVMGWGFLPRFHCTGCSSSATYFPLLCPLLSAV